MGAAPISSVSVNIFVQGFFTSDADANAHYEWNSSSVNATADAGAHCEWYRTW